MITVRNRQQVEGDALARAPCGKLLERVVLTGDSDGRRRVVAREPDRTVHAARNRREPRPAAANRRHAPTGVPGDLQHPAGPPVDRLERRLERPGSRGEEGVWLARTLAE